MRRPAKNWDDAHLTAQDFRIVTCNAEDKRGHLATLGSCQELLALNWLLAGMGLKEGWIGGYRCIGGDCSHSIGWLNVTGEPFIGFWQRNQPDNARNSEFVQQIVGYGITNDDTASELSPFIIEIDGLSVPRLASDLPCAGGSCGMVDLSMVVVRPTPRAGPNATPTPDLQDGGYYLGTVPDDLPTPTPTPEWEIDTPTPDPGSPGQGYDMWEKTPTIN